MLSSPDGIGTLTAKPLTASVTFHGDAVTLLTVFLVLLVALPARLIIAPLGAVGTPAMLVGLLALLWWLSSRVVPLSGMPTGLQPIRVAILLFGTAVVASYAAAVSQPLTASELRSLDRGVIMVAAWVGIALLAADGIGNRARLDTLLRRLIMAVTLLAAAGIVEFFTRVNPSSYLAFPGLTANVDLPATLTASRSSFNRVAATALHPIEFGVILSVVLPLAVHYAISASPRERLRHWTSVAIIAAALPMSISRSAILGVAVGGTVLLVSWSWQRRLLAVLAGGTFLGLFSAAIPGLLGALRNSILYASSDVSVVHRTEALASAATLIAQAPILGIGFNGFVPSHYFFLDNQYVGAVIELGIVGAVALIVLLATPFFTARGARRRSGDPITRSLGQALAASAAAIIVTFYAFDALGFPMFAGITMLIFGCCGALWRLEASPNMAQARPGEAVAL